MIAQSFPKVNFQLLIVLMSCLRGSSIWGWGRGRKGRQLEDQKMWGPPCKLGPRKGTGSGFAPLQDVPGMLREHRVTLQSDLKNSGLLSHHFYLRVEPGVPLTSDTAGR